MKSKTPCLVVIVFALHTFSFAQSGTGVTSPSPAAHGPAAVNTPRVAEPERITQLPAELPQRVSGLAFDGEKFWVAIYRGGGRHATLDRVSLSWKVGEPGKPQDAVSDLAGALGGPGGICFADGKLWVAGSAGDSFGAIDPRSWKVERRFRGEPREVLTSQSYSSMAYDGSHLWIVRHWFNYELPASQTQVLLKVDPSTGKVVGEYPAPAGTAPDGAHGLTWDGSRLWHMKDSRLSAVDPSTGAITARYYVEQVKRPSGLAWDGEALWIVEFDGVVWRLRL